MTASRAGGADAKPGADINRWFPDGPPTRVALGAPWLRLPAFAYSRPEDDARLAELTAAIMRGDAP